VIMAQKTINITFYPNTALKPSTIEEQKFYPLYVRVGYNRKNTKFKFIPQLFVPEEYLNDFNKWLEVMSSEKDDLRGEIKLSENQIIGLIRYEEEKLGNDFILKGLGNRLRLYKIIILDKINDILSGNFNAISKAVLTVNQFEKAKDLFITEKIKLIYDEYGQDTLSNILSYQTEYGIASNFILPQMINFSLYANFIAITDNKQFTIYDWLIKGKRNDYINFVKDFVKNLKEGDEDDVILLFRRLSLKKSELLDLGIENNVIGIDGIINATLQNKYGDLTKLLHRLDGDKLIMR